MEELSIESQMLSRIGYNDAESILEIEFKKNSQIWQYFDVPESSWNEFKNAGSYGRFFLRNIKGHYRECQIR